MALRPELSAPRGLVVVSGGQTGADRAALDVAIDLGLGHGGWCPRGRAAEDGVIDGRYAMWETDAVDPSARTVANVGLGDGTLVLLPERGVSPGTELTIRTAGELERPCMVFRESDDPARIAEWIAGESIRVLNVAGPRESEWPGLYRWTADALRDALEERAVPRRESRTAVWAIPERGARRVVQRVIDELAETTGARPFVPHWTLGAGTPTEMRDLAREAATGVAVLECEVRGLESSLADPRRRLAVTLDAVGDAAALPLREVPHVSLSYSTSDEESVVGVPGALGTRIAFDQVWTVEVGGARAPTPEDWVLRACEPVRGRA